MKYSADSYISVVALVRDCAPRVEGFIRETVAVLESRYTNYELVLMEDGSQDDSLLRCRTAVSRFESLRVIQFSRNYGDEAAYHAGLDTAIGDVVVLLSAKEDSPDAIPFMVDACRRGSGVAVVVDTGGVPQSWMRRNASAAFHWYLHRRLRVAYVPGSHYCWSFSRTAVNAFLSRPRIPRLLRFNAAQLGMVPVPVVLSGTARPQLPRQRVLINDLVAGLSVIIACSLAPFRMACVAGLLAALVLFGGIAVIGPALPHALGVLAVCTGLTLALGFVALLFLGEHTARHMAELSGRKDYIVVAEYSSNTSIRDLSRRNIVAAPL